MKSIKILSVLLSVCLALLVSWYLVRQTKSVEVTSDTVEKGSYVIVAFGDSLTAGYGLPLYESYPQQLEEALKAKGLDVSVINAGVSGETSSGNNERASFIKDQNPDMIIWGIGGNDALRALSVMEMKKHGKYHPNPSEWATQTRNTHARDAITIKCWYTI